MKCILCPAEKRPTSRAVGTSIKTARRGRPKRLPPPSNQNKRGRTRGSRSCLWVVEEGLLGWVWRGQARLKDVHGLPVAAEILRDARRELESHAKPAVLEEDIGVLELGHVEGDTLALLREGAFGAPDQARALEAVDAAVAGSDRDSVLAAKIDRRLRL